MKSPGKHLISGIMRQRLGWLTSSVLMVLAAGAPVMAQNQAPFVQETFENATLNPANQQFWQYGTSNDPNNAPSDPPCLTAAALLPNPPIVGTGIIPGCPTTTTGANGNNPLDPNGQGVLRLTPNKNNQAAFVLYNNPLPTGKGLQITFEFYSYDSSDNPVVTGADGINFFLINGATNPTTAGAFGGSLGYAQKTNVPGIVGGYLGIGLDEYGNYSNPTEGRNGGTGFKPNAVALRGAEAAGYPFLPRPDGNNNFTLPGQLAFPNSPARPLAKRLARVTLTADNRISVDIDFGGTGNNFVNVIPLSALSAIQPTVALPSTLKFGFAASTGSSTNIHEIRNLVVTTAPPTITKVHNGNFIIGQNGTYTLRVQNGGATGPITVTDTLPQGLTFCLKYRH